MNLKKVLELRKTGHVKQEKNKSGIMTLEEALELRKAKKYIKRTGSPGNYKYYYRDETGKLLAPGAKEQISGRIIRQKEKKPVSSKKYMEEHGEDIRREADELKRMSEEDFKRKKEKYDKEKKGLTTGQKVNIAYKKWQQAKTDKKKAMVTVGGDTVGAARKEKQAKASYEIILDTFKRKEKNK